MVDEDDWRRCRRPCVVLLDEEIPLVHPVHVCVVLNQLERVTERQVDRCESGDEL